MRTAAHHPHVADAQARSARAHFQPRYATPLTDEDGREIATNLVGFVGILREWRARRDAERAAVASSLASGSPSKRRRRCSTSNPQNPTE